MKQPAIICFLRYLSSGKLALLLVAILILFSLVGVIFPQKGQLHPQQILQWQQQHPALTKAFEPWGFFTVFHSVPFMITIGLLAINTLTCTVLHFVQKGSFRALTGPGAIGTAGFLLLHLSFIVLFIGGFISAAARMDGYILQTEGQTFTDRPENYLRYTQGFMTSSNNAGFSMTLKKVDVKYEKSEYVVDMTAELQFQSSTNQSTEGLVRVNYPFSYRGKAFTLDDTGYSPRLVLRRAGEQMPLVNSFVALQTLTSGHIRQYRDYLPLPFFENKVIVELFPVGSKDTQTGRMLKEPLMILKTDGSQGEESAPMRLALGQKATLDGYEFEFAELRQWASFRISKDPGYPVVWTALWLGMIALLMRYLPELRDWQTKPISCRES